MAYKISKKQVEQLNMSNEASRRFGEIGLGSVIEEISKSGGGSGTPPDYDELQDTVSGHTQDIKTINNQIQTINENIEGLYNPDSIDAGDADNTDMNNVMLMRSVIKHTEETIEFSVVDSPKSENEYSTIDEIADVLSETNRYSNIIINIKTSKDITYKTDTYFNGYGFRTLTLNFDRKINIDSVIYFKNFVDVTIFGNGRTLYFNNSFINIKNCGQIYLNNFILNASSDSKDLNNIIISDSGSVYLDAVSLNKGNNCISITNTKILNANQVKNISNKALNISYIITTKDIYDKLVPFSNMTNYLIYN